MSASGMKSIQSLEEKMQGLDQNSLRYHILESAKKFKTSWIDLGRALYSVWKDKLYKGWGYEKIETYVSREIGIRKQTAMKLLRSYYFLEKEEPQYLKEDYTSSAQAGLVPSYESVDILRLAKNKKELDTQDYDRLKKDVFEKGRDCRDVKRDLTALIRQREELNPQEAYQKKRLGTIRRFLGALKAIKQEIEISKLLPNPLIKEAAQLIKKLEEEIS
jgi:hypothetical protein